MGNAICDSHVHIVGPYAKYPQVPERTYLAGVASVAALKTLGAARGIARFVVVQPSFYGADNSATLDALDELSGNGRGVAVIDPKATSPETLAMFHRRGVRGCASISTVRSRRRAATRSKPRSPRPRPPRA